MENKNCKTLEMLKRCLDYYYGNILISDVSGKILYVNDTLVKSYGLTMEKALSMSVYDLVTEGVLDRSAVINVIETGEASLTKIGISSGAKIDCVAKPVYNDDGKMEYIIAFSYDESFMSELQNEGYAFVHSAGKQKVQTYNNSR